MLKKHGYAARVDLKEAKEILEREARSSSSAHVKDTMSKRMFIYLFSTP